MKKLMLLTLSSLFLLGGCAQLDKAIKGDKTNPSTEASLDVKKFEAKLKERINALNKADFPQLSPDIAEDEAAVKLMTSKGDITIKLFPKEAPLAVENFLTHAKNGYYNGLIFHRVINDFMVQTGDPEGTGAGGQSIWSGVDASIDSGRGFKNELSDYLYHIRGALSMANAGPDTNGSQFFIVQNQRDWSAQLDASIYPEKIIEAYKSGGYPSLDASYSIFGQVISGMEVVDAIAAVETDNTDKPIEPVTITSIEILNDYTFK